MEALSSCPRTRGQLLLVIIGEVDVLALQGLHAAPHVGDDHLNLRVRRAAPWCLRQVLQGLAPLVDLGSDAPNARALSPVGSLPALFLQPLVAVCWLY